MSEPRKEKRILRERATLKEKHGARASQGKRKACILNEPYDVKSTANERAKSFEKQDL